MNFTHRNAVLVPGFNVSDGGEATVNKVAQAFRGIVQRASYGWFGVASVLLYNDNIASVMAGMALPGSVGVGHSNGCALLLRAARLGAGFSDLILINPALEEVVEFPPQLSSIHVYYNKGDIPVRFAKLLNVVIPGSFLWGAMGRVGYKGTDPRVINHDMSDICDGHSDIFNYPEILIDSICRDLNSLPNPV